MKLYFAGNFTVTDEIENELELKKTLGKDYHRLCTFFYPKAADVIIQNVKPKIPKKVQINEEGLNTKNHPALQTKGEDNENEKSHKKTKNRKNRKTIKIKRKIKR